VAIYTPVNIDDRGNASLAMLRHVSEDYLRHHAPLHGHSRMLRCYLAPGVYLRVVYRHHRFEAHVERMSANYPEVRTRDWDEFRRGLAVLIKAVESDYFEDDVPDGGGVPQSMRTTNTGCSIPGIAEEDHPWTSNINARSSTTCSDRSGELSASRRRTHRSSGVCYVSSRRLCRQRENTSPR
jgi:hypothetical protein